MKIWIATVYAASVLLLLGCQDASEAPSTSGSSNAETSSASGGGSVAASSGGQPPDATMEPQAPASPVPPVGPQETHQASPDELSRVEESAGMPQAGQANDHSTLAPSSDSSK